MAVTETFSRVSYIGNGSAVEFSFESKVFALTDLSVIVKDLTTGIETPLVVDIDYTSVAVSGDLDNGVTIDTSAGSTPATYTSNDQLTLIRTIAETQDLNLEEGGDLPANELEDALDRGVMIGQQNADEGARHLVHPVTDPVGLSYEAPTVEIRRGLVVGWDDDGNIVAISVATEGGAITGVNTDKGLSLSGGVVSGKVDGASLEFSGGNFAVKASGIDTGSLAPSAVTLPKLANMSTASVLGRTTAGSGAVEEVPIDGGIFGAVTPFVPTITQGVAVSATVTAANYVQNGSVITVSIALAVTGSGTSGQSIVVGNLPAGLGSKSGAFFIDANSTTYVGTTTNVTDTGVNFKVGGAVGDSLGVSPAFALTSGDRIILNMTYISA
jgi:hypothetical protein